MFRFVLSIAAMLLAFGACSQAPDTAAPAAANQAANPQEITAGQIGNDLVGKVLRISDAAGTGPSDEWTFEAGEFRQVDILESQRSGNSLTVVIQMTTRNNPKPEEFEVQVSGKLRLRYELKEGRWTLNAIENLTFRYSIGVAT